MKDTARVLGRMYDGIEYRGAGQSQVEILAEHSGVPVWHGPTHEWHPTQSLWDIMTMIEHPTKPHAETSFACRGYSPTNSARSTRRQGPITGMDLRLCEVDGGGAGSRR